MSGENRLCQGEIAELEICEKKKVIEKTTKNVSTNKMGEVNEIRHYSFALETGMTQYIQFICFS